jgi:low affinity Fe/Cu permease
VVRHGSGIASERWQLAINTIMSVVTLTMVFVIQRA